jgi:hypothetical protein
VLRTVPLSDAVRLRCEFAPTGRTWGFDAWRSIGRLLYQQQPVGRAGWLFTEQELQLDSLEKEVAIGLARDLVMIASAWPLPAPNRAGADGTARPRHAAAHAHTNGADRPVGVRVPWAGYSNAIVTASPWRTQR